MESKKLVYEDDEKSVYGLYVLDDNIPDWIFLGGNPDGWGCLTARDSLGNMTLTSLFYGCSWNHPDTKCFAIVPKKPQRKYELYAISFVGGCFNGLTCYAEEQWDIPLQEVLDRFHNLNAIPGIQECARKYAVPKLIYHPDQVEHEFDKAKSTVKDIFLKKLLSHKEGIGRLKRQSLYHWAVGIKDKTDQHVWLAISLFWNKLEQHVETLAHDIVQQQQLSMFASNSERATTILHQVIKPFTLKYKISNLARRCNTQDQLIMLEQWVAENFMQLMSECFTEYWQNERN